MRDGEQVHVYIPEIKQNVLLFPRSDGIEDRWYLVKNMLMIINGQRMLTLD